MLLGADQISPGSSRSLAAPYARIQDSQDSLALGKLEQIVGERGRTQVVAGVMNRCPGRVHLSNELAKVARLFSQGARFCSRVDAFRAVYPQVTRRTRYSALARSNSLASRSGDSGCVRSTASAWRQDSSPSVKACRSTAAFAAFFHAAIAGSASPASVQCRAIVSGWSLANATNFLVIAIVKIVAPAAVEEYESRTEIYA